MTVVTPSRGSAAPVTAVVWTQEARERLGRVPSFMRGRVERSAEEYARQQGLTLVTPEVLDHLRRRAFGGAPPPGVFTGPEGKGGAGAHGQGGHMPPEDAR